MDLSIVIVNYRSWDDLRICLHSLAPLIGSKKKPDVEVIVIDNRSGDGRLASFARQFSTVRFKENRHNAGFAHACNVGAQLTTGDQILFLNPDAHDPGGQIALFWQLKVKYPEVAILGVRLRDHNGRVQKSFDRFPSPLRALSVGRILLRCVAPHDNPNPRTVVAHLRSVDWVTGAALMITRHTLLALDGWCDDYWMYSEDVDLCRRASAAGLATAYTTEVTLFHRHGGASRSSPRIHAKTKAETIISRHLYAHRHLFGWRRRLYQTLLVITRYIPLAIFALICRLWPGKCSSRVVIHATVFNLLSQYYRRVRAHGTWRSPRSINSLASK